MLKIVKFTDVCMTGGIILAYSNVFEFLAAILEKGLLAEQATNASWKDYNYKNFSCIPTGLYHVLITSMF